MRVATFWNNVDRSAGPDGCWPWTSQLNSAGYGYVRSFRAGIPGRMAHRVAYEYVLGPIPEGLVLDHLCRNPPCVNPAHLEPVTFRENILRGTGASARQARKTHCVNGHPFSAENTRVNSRGHRRCLTCEATYRYNKLFAKHGRPPLVNCKDRTHCLSGHEFTAENTRIRTDGSRACRACARRWTREYRERQVVAS